MYKLLVLVLVVLASAAAYAYAARPVSEGITWMLPHQNQRYFDRATSTFDEVLRAQSGGALHLSRTVYPKDLGVEPTDHFTMKLLTDNRVQLVSDYLEHDSAHVSKLNALALPYVFESYDDALAFLDSPYADNVLRLLEEKTEFKALAFTMSGGMKVFVAPERIDSPDDLQGKRIWSYFFGGPQIATLTALGATPVFSAIHETSPDPEFLKTVDGVETTYSRILLLVRNAPWFGKYVVDTNHSLSLTLLVVSKEYFNGLTKKQQGALVAAAKEAAKVEKADTVKQEGLIRAELESRGVRVVRLTAAQKESFRKATASVNTAYEDTFRSVLDDIRDQKAAR